VTPPQNILAEEQHDSKSKLVTMLSDNARTGNYPPSPGKGSAPILPNSEALLNSTAQNTASAAALQTRSILIVDDSHLVTQALRVVLGNAGFKVSTFNTGLAALRHAAELRPDAAIIDIHLPDISGLVLTQRLRDMLGAETPLVILSGDTSMETINSLPHVGATYFFPKPVQGTQLVARLREWMEESPSSEID
jgi:CheY-like chemotaxis protein